MDHDELVGFANLYDLVPQQRAFIGNVIVKTSQRGQGTGEYLVEYMLDRIFTHHRLPEAMILVFADNRPAFNLYRKLGFKTVSSTTRQGSDGRAMILLQMKLVRGL